MHIYNKERILVSSPPIPLLWESSVGAATLLQAKRNSALKLLFIYPLGKKDLEFIKTRERYISPSHDFIAAGYSSAAAADHTQSIWNTSSACLPDPLFEFELSQNSVFSVPEMCASQDSIETWMRTTLAVTWSWKSNYASTCSQFRFLLWNRTYCKCKLFRCFYSHMLSLTTDMQCFSSVPCVRGLYDFFGLTA